MDPQQWLDDVRTELNARRLPRRYVARLLRELSDHVTDDGERSMSQDAEERPGPLERLGSPRLVAQSAEREFRRRSFAARHPVWTFGLFPPLLVLLLALGLFVGSAALLDGSLALLDRLLDLTPLERYESSPWVPLVARSYLVGCIVLAAVLVAAVFAGLARRCGLPRRWPLTAAFLTSLVCGALWTSATAKTPEQMGTVSIGVSNSFSPRRISFPQVVQFAAPLAVAVWVTRRRRAMDDPPGTLPSVA